MKFLLLALILEMLPGILLLCINQLSKIVSRVLEYYVLVSWVLSPAVFNLHMQK